MNTKQFLVYVFCLLAMFKSAAAQNSLKVKGLFGVYRQDKKIGKNQYIALLEQQNNTFAFKKFNASRDYQVVALVGLVGGLAGIGYEMRGRLTIDNYKKNDAILGAGVGSFGLGILFGILSKTALHKSVRLYNEKLGQNTSAFRPYLRFQTTSPNTIGLVLKW
jgi:hypothetical protein